MNILILEAHEIDRPLPRGRFGPSARGQGARSAVVPAQANPGVRRGISFYGIIHIVILHIY